MATTTITTPQSKVSMTAQLASGAPPAQIGTSVNHSSSSNPSVANSAGNITKMYAAALTVTSGTPLDLDLTALTDPLGNPVSFALLTDIFITNDSTVAGQILTIGAGTTPVFAAALALTIGPNGGELKWVDRQVGITIDSTHKILRITVAAGTSVPFEISLWGR